MCGSLLVLIVFMLHSILSVKAMFLSDGPFLEPIMNKDINFELIVQEISDEPDTQGWSKCMYCQLQKSQIVFFDSSNSSSLINLSWSHWGEFFHKFNNDQLVGTKSALNFVDDTNIVRTPVYILTMITFHLGHILVDFLEQMYFSMLTLYGEVRKDALMIIDVAGNDERVIIQYKLDYITSFCSVHSFGCVMRSALTKLSFYSLDVLGSALGLHAVINTDTKIVFENVHIGLDTSRSFYQLGYAFHPCVLNRCCGNNDVMEASQHYQHFSEHFTSVAVNATNYRRDLVSLSTDQNDVCYLLLVRRRVDRVITNLNESLMCNHSFNAIISEVFLEELTFEDQLTHFQKADILVASAGTALHNMMFMRNHATAVVVVMQTGWCSWAWMYANQAALLGIRAFIYCADATNSQIIDEVDPMRIFQWSRRFWRQGPKPSKAANISLDIIKFDKIIFSARQYVNEARISSFPANFSANQCSTDYFCGAGVTPTSVRQNTRCGEKNEVSIARRKRIELYIASFSVSHVAIDNDRNTSSWQVGIAGEISITRADDSHRGGLSSMGHMSICLQVLPIGPTWSVQKETIVPTWCYPIESLNYFSELFLNVGGPVYLLHFWVEVASFGGKFQNSDVYHIIDCSMPNGGFTVLNSARTMDFTVVVDENVVNSTSIPIRLHGKYSFQIQITDICKTHYLFNASGCGVFIAKVARQILFDHLLAKVGLPSVQHMPSAKEPFVFLHIEKTGGTTIREFITESADSLHITSFIPCHGGVHCVTLELPVDNSLGNVSVVAGHFFWGVWKVLPSCSLTQGSPVEITNASSNASMPNVIQRGGGIHSSGFCRPSCMVIGRHPVDRAISYYYQRCYQLESCIGYQRRINELSVEELEFVAIHERQAAYGKDNSTLLILDEGMSNAACRSLADAKTTSGLHVSAEISILLPPPLSDEDVSQAITNVRQCVVGIFDRWDATLTVMSEWFPWLSLHVGRSRHKMFLFSDKESPEQLRPDLRDLLVRLNYCDMVLYTEMQILFEAQLSVLSEKNLYFK